MPTESESSSSPSSTTSTIRSPISNRSESGEISKKETTTKTFVSRPTQTLPQTATAKSPPRVTYKKFISKRTDPHWDSSPNSLTSPFYHRPTPGESESESEAESEGESDSKTIRSSNSDCRKSFRNYSQRTKSTGKDSKGLKKVSEEPKSDDKTIRSSDLDCSKSRRKSLARSCKSESSDPENTPSVRSANEAYQSSKKMMTVGSPRLVKVSRLKTIEQPNLSSDSLTSPYYQRPTPGESESEVESECESDSKTIRSSDSDCLNSYRSYSKVSEASKRSTSKESSKGTEEAGEEPKSKFKSDDETVRSTDSNSSGLSLARSSEFESSDPESSPSLRSPNESSVKRVVEGSPRLVKVSRLKTIDEISESGPSQEAMGQTEADKKAREEILSQILEALKLAKAQQQAAEYKEAIDDKEADEDEAQEHVEAIVVLMEHQNKAMEKKSEDQSQLQGPEDEYNSGEEADEDQDQQNYDTKSLVDRIRELAVESDDWLVKTWLVGVIVLGAVLVAKMR